MKLQKKFWAQTVLWLQNVLFVLKFQQSIVKKLTFIQFKSLSIIKSPKLMYPSHFPKPSGGPDLCRTNSGEDALETTI